MHLSQLIQSRYSVRAYQDKPVPRQTLEDIISQACLSPSSSNLQPWKLYVLSGEIKQQLSEAVITQLQATKDSSVLPGETPDYALFPDPMDSPYQERRLQNASALYSLLDANLNDMEKRQFHLMRNYQFYGAPVGIILTQERTMQTGQFIDLGMFLQSLLLLCEEQGLSTCPQAAWALWPNTVRKTLGIPDGQIVVCGVSVGYEDKAASVNRHRSTRIAPNDVANYLGF